MRIPLASLQQLSETVKACVSNADQQLVNEQLTYVRFLCNMCVFLSVYSLKLIIDFWLASCSVLTLLQHTVKRNCVFCSSQNETAISSSLVLVLVAGTKSCVQSLYKTEDFLRFLAFGVRNFASYSPAKEHSFCYFCYL